MAKLSSLALFSLLMLLLFISSTFGNSDVPFMVAHKKISLNRLKSGAEQVSVSIDVYNKGSATAYDVSLKDDSWPQDTFDLLSGSTSKTWERLDAGSTISHSFILESKAKGLFHGSPALIKFRVPTRSALQEAFSTPILPLDILAERPEKKFEWAKRLLTKYGSLFSVLLLVITFVYVVASPSKSGAAKGSKKRR